jgi:hypothetical protein
MEALAISGVVMGLGYFFQESKKKVQDTSENEKPSSTNIYNSDRVEEVNKTILNLSAENYKKSENPMISGIIPPLFNSANSTPVSTTIGNSVIFQEPSFLKKEDDLQNTLTGFSSESSHGNMVPFFGGSIKQNTEHFKNTGILDNYTGVRSFIPEKKEVENFFDLQKENIHGMPVFSSQFDTSRFIPSMFRQGEKPFLDQKVAAPISGTLNDPLSQNFEKTIDELRPLSKQQVTYEGRLKSGQMGSVSGVIGDVNKNRPETSFESGSDRFFTGPGAYTANIANKNYDNLKSTTRQDQSRDYYGTGFSSVQGIKQEGQHSDPFKQQLDSDFSLNVQGPNQNNKQQWLQNYQSVAQERDSTSDVSKLMSIKGNSQFKLRFADLPKETNKESIVDKYDNVRNLQFTINGMANTGITDNVPKQTIKEENLLEDYIGIIKVNEHSSSSRDQYSNIEIDNKKQDVLQNKPVSKSAQSGTISIGKDNIHVDKWKVPIHKNSEVDRLLSKDSLTNHIGPSMHSLGETRLANGKTIIDSRFDTTLFKPLETNPFSVSII